MQTPNQMKELINNVLITGGAGFIGSHLVQVLIKLNKEITVVDNLSRGAKKNIGTAINQITFISDDICNSIIIEELIKKSDLVIHLAALSRVIPSINDPELCFHSNIQGTEIVARMCAKHKKKIIFSSSREVYGEVKELPVDENFPLNPVNPYGASKVAGEKIIESYHHSFGLEYGIIRLANVYGLGDFDRVIPIFINAALKEDNIKIFGGNQIIDFIHVDDVVMAIIKLMDINNSFVCNIGSGKGISLHGLSAIILHETNSLSQINHLDKRTGEVDKFISNTAKISGLIDWHPRISLNEGLSQLIAEKEENFEASNN